MLHKIEKDIPDIIPEECNIDKYYKPLAINYPKGFYTIIKVTIPYKKIKGNR